MVNLMAINQESYDNLIGAIERYKHRIWKILEKVLLYVIETKQANHTTGKQIRIGVACCL